MIPELKTSETALTVEATDVSRIELSKNTLLIPYALIPLVALVPVIDLIFYGGRLTAALPESPEVVFTFTLFFIFPHIVASAMLIANRDYVTTYKHRLTIGLVGSIAIGVIIPLTFGYLTLLAVFGVLTINHVIGQQVGLTRINLKVPNTTFRYWKMSGLLLGNLVYFYIYFKGSYFLISATSFLAIALTIFTANLLFFLKVYRTADTGDSRRFLIANQVLLLAITILAAADYSFFAILLPRVIHDVCAFMVYWVHDSNRHIAGKGNILMTSEKSRNYTCWSTPIAALILAFPITYFYNTYYGVIVGIIIALFHYYTDGFAWKRDSLLRSYVPTKKS